MLRTIKPFILAGAAVFSFLFAAPGSASEEHAAMMNIDSGMAIPVVRAVGQPVNLKRHSSQATLPSGVSTGWWSEVQKQIGQDQYSILRHDQQIYYAQNQANRFQIRFSEDGISITPIVANDGDANWRWGLKLHQSTDLIKGVDQAIHVRENSIEYQREGITEWYLNDENGLEQGFTIPVRPETQGDHSELQINLSLSGNLHPRFAENGQAVDFYDKGNVNVLRYAQLNVKDASGMKLPARFEGIPGGIRIVVDDPRAIYPITVDPIATAPAWAATGEAAGNYFGYSLATAGDVNADGYSDVIVGAFAYNGSIGKAYLYVGGRAGLSTIPAWTATGEAASNFFGSSVGTAGDVNGDGYSDVIVSAPGLSSKAYLYLGGPSGISSASAWTATGETTDDGFGVSVSTAGDVNRDGYSDVIVGAYTYNSGTGKAYLYMGGPSGLSGTAAWTASGEAVSNLFGVSVSTAGDVNGDGHSDVLVGAPGYNSSAGKVYLYLGSPSGLSNASNWTATGEAILNSFAFSVSTAGDVNGDGYSDVLIGAQDYNSSAGKAYLYLSGESGLSSTPAWTATGEAAGNTYGVSVATAGDVNGDGYSDVLIGASRYNNSTGRSYLYLGGLSGLFTAAAWTMTGEVTNNYFGNSVATAGDVNGDGYSDLLIGAYYYSGAHTGKAYLYTGGPSSLSSTSGWTATGEAMNDSSGYSVAMAGDVNGDGYTDVLLGACGSNNDAGKVYLHMGGPSGLSSTPAWTAAGTTANDCFGYSVATAGDVNGDGYSDVLIGARGYNNGAGKAYLYLGGTTGLSNTPAWTATGESVFDHFASSLGSAGDVNGDGYSDVIVGADGYNSSTGKAYLYLGGHSGLSSAPAWTVTGEATGSYFGSSVATAGDVNRDGYSDVLVGAYIGNMDLTGSAYAYLGGPAGLSSAPVWSATGEGVNSLFGYSVSTAGDVNGDGYSDILVGAIWDNERTGKVYLYAGGPSGISDTPYWTTTGEATNNYFGLPVATAGDVNGDGYSDVLVGAYGSDSNTGKVYLYLGAPSGLLTTADWIAVGEATSDYFGYSVAVAGDVNGDGRSDVLVGAYGNNNNTGKTYLFWGGGDGPGIPLRPQQLREDLSAPISPLGPTGNGLFALSLSGRTPFGSGRVKLEWQLAPLAGSFDTVLNPIQSGYNWFETGTDGAWLIRPVILADGNGPYMWRMRTRFNPVTTPFQGHGPWLTLADNSLRETDLRRLPLCAITLDQAPLPDGTSGTAYSQTLTASDGIPPYTFAVTAGALPSGLSLNGATGEITGTPTLAGTFNFTITATDNINCTASQAYTINIACTSITVNPATLPDGATGTAYSQIVSGSGGTAPYTFAITAGALPTGLSMNSSTGEISGTPTATGTFNFTATATDSFGCAGSQVYTVNINCPGLTMSPPTLPNGTVGTAYSQTLSVSGGAAPYSFAVTTGVLPSGLALNGSTGKISGTPTTVESQTFAITATDASGCTVSLTNTITVDAACLFCDDFEDGVLDPNWSYVKPAWSESGGALIGSAPTGAAVAIAAPVLGGCTSCFMEATMSAQGGKVWLLGWYVDKKNTIELIMEPDADKWIFKEKILGKTVAKTKATSTIDLDTFYRARIAYNGTQFVVTVDGNPLMTIPAGSSTHMGTVGFQVKSTVASFGEVIVNP